MSIAQWDECAYLTKDCLNSIQTPLDVHLRNVKPSHNSITGKGRKLPKGGCSGAKDSSVAEAFWFKARLCQMFSDCKLNNCLAKQPKLLKKSSANKGGLRLVSKGNLWVPSAQWLCVWGSIWKPGDIQICWGMAALLIHSSAGESRCYPVIQAPWVGSSYKTVHARLLLNTFNYIILVKLVQTWKSFLNQEHPHRITCRRAGCKDKWGRTLLVALHRVLPWSPARSA